MLASTTLQSMRARRGNVLGALVAHALAVAIMLGAILVLLSTFDGPGQTARLGATDLVARPDLTAIFDTPEDSVPQDMHIRLSPETVEAIRDVDGVDHVVSDVTFAAQLLDEDGAPVVVSEDATPRGQSWESAALTPFVVTDGGAPEAEREVVIDAQTAVAADLSVGDRTRIVTNRGTATYQVAGVARPESGEDLERQAAIFFSPAAAAELSGSGDSADLVGVFLAEGADPDAVRDRIRAATDGMDVQVLSGTDRAKADVTAGALEVTELGIVLGVLCGFVGFVAIFVLSSTFGFSIQQREREIGLQRAIGYTPRQVRRMILVEALAIAAVGSVIGLAGGMVLARAFVRVAIWFGKAPESFSVSFSSVGVAIVLSSSFAITLLAAWLAGRKTTKIRPIEALRSASAPTSWIGWRRLLLGLLFVGGSGVVIAISPALPPDAAAAMSLAVTALLTIGCAVLGAALVVPFVRLARPLMRFGESITGEVALNNTRRMAARVASATTPVLLGVGFMTLMFGFTQTLETATMQVTEDRAAADLYAIPVAAALPGDVEGRIAGIDGVEQASAISSMQVSYVWADSTTNAETAIVDPDTIGALENLEFSSGGPEAFEPGTVIVSNMLEFSGTTGDTMTMTMDDGRVRTFTVVGESTNLIGLGDILMTSDDAAEHAVDVAPNVVAISLTDGADRQVIAGAVEALAADGYPLQAVSRDDYVAGARQSLQDGEWASYLIIGGAAAFGMVAVVNTLAMATAERAREFALMRLIGATPRQILRMLAKEASIVCLIGLALGWGIAIASTSPVSIGLVGDLTAMSMPILPLIGTGLVAVAVIFASTLIPGALALRRAPMAEIGRRE